MAPGEGSISISQAGWSDEIFMSRLAGKRVGHRGARAREAMLAKTHGKLFNCFVSLSFVSFAYLRANQKMPRRCFTP